MCVFLCKKRAKYQSEKIGTLEQRRDDDEIQGVESSVESCNMGAKLSSGYHSAPVLSQSNSIHRSISTRATVAEQ